MVIQTILILPDSNNHILKLKFPSKKAAVDVVSNLTVLIGPRIVISTPKLGIIIPRVSDNSLKLQRPSRISGERNEGRNNNLDLSQYSSIRGDFSYQRSIETDFFMGDGG